MSKRKRRQTTGAYFNSPSFEPDERGSFWVLLPLGDDEPHGDWRVLYRIEKQDRQAIIAEIRILPWPNNHREEQWIAETLRDPDLDKWVILDDDGNAKGPALQPPAVPDGGLTTRALRGLRTTEALERARDKIALSDDIRRVTGFSARALDDARWRIRTDRLLAEVSAVYVEVLDSRTPIKELTRRLADQGAHYAEATVRDLLNEARNRVLLTRPRKGRAGGQLTDKAKALLNGKSNA